MVKQNLIKAMDSKRFNALACHSRNPAAAYVSKELAWYSNISETVIGVILLDLIGLLFIFKRRLDINCPKASAGVS